MNNVEILSVHYKTPDLIYNQYKTIRQFYPEIKYRIIDGSDDNKKYFIDLEKKDSNFSVQRLGFNIHHGPGMDFGLKTSDKDFLLIIDSDVSLKKPLLNEMFDLFNGYSVGKLITINSDGYELWQKPNESKINFIYKYTHPYCMLINKKRYLDFKPFIKHGAPCLQSMIDLYEKGLTKELTNFDITNYVELKIRGTRSRWGINL